MTSHVLDKMLLRIVLVVVSLCVVVTSQSRQPIPLTYEIVEEVNVGSRIVDLRQSQEVMSEFPSQQRASLTFSFLGAPTIDVSLDGETGLLATSGRLDRDVICEHAQDCRILMTLMAKSASLYQMVKVTLVIADLNDNAPVFSEARITRQVLESSALGSGFSLPEAFDPDSPRNGIRQYELRGGLEHFSLLTSRNPDNSTSLRVVISRELDREMMPEFHLQLVAIDAGGLNGSVMIHVDVIDANDNDPVFESPTYAVTVTENVDIGRSVLRVRATDADEGRNAELVYRFTTRTQHRFGHLFTVDPISGDVIVTGVLDREAQEVVHLTVLAEDVGPNTLPAETLVTITVVDVNDNRPQISINTLTGWNASCLCSIILFPRVALFFVNHERKSEIINLAWNVHV